MTQDVIKTYEAIITNMAKLLEVQQSRESVVIDMISAAVAVEREACAEIADKLPRTYRETKEAHERATLEPFHPSRFGFDFAEMRQAEVITHAIRARGQA